MNGFSTEEDSHDGPPAPPFYGQSCCLIEDGERCGRSAGNASFSKRIQKSISQKKLKLDIDKSVSERFLKTQWCMTDQKTVIVTPQLSANAKLVSFR